MSYLDRCCGRVPKTWRELEAEFDKIEELERALIRDLTTLRESPTIPLSCNFYFSFAEFDMIPGYRIWQDRKRLLAHYPED